METPRYHETWFVEWKSPTCNHTSDDMELKYHASNIGIAAREDVKDTKTLGYCQSANGTLLPPRDFPCKGPAPRSSLVPLQQVCPGWLAVSVVLGMGMGTAMKS